MTRGDLTQTLATIALIVAVTAGAVIGVDVQVCQRTGTDRSSGVGLAVPTSLGINASRLTGPRSSHCRGLSLPAAHPYVSVKWSRPSSPPP